MTLRILEIVYALQFYQQFNHTVIHTYISFFFFRFVVRLKRFARNDQWTATDGVAHALIHNCRGDFAFNLVRKSLDDALQSDWKSGHMSNARQLCLHKRLCLVLSVEVYSWAAVSILSSVRHRYMRAYRWNSADYLLFIVIFAQRKHRDFRHIPFKWVCVCVCASVARARHRHQTIHVKWTDLIECLPIKPAPVDTFSVPLPKWCSLKIRNIVENLLNHLNLCTTFNSNHYCVYVLKPHTKHPVSTRTAFRRF